MFEMFESEAYYQGVDAARDMIDLDDNPYPPGSKFFDDWEHGWCDEVKTLKPNKNMTRIEIGTITIVIDNLNRR